MKQKPAYRPLRKTDAHLVCFQSEHGKGKNREYLVLLDAHTLQEVNLAENTAKVYHSSPEPLAEYSAWKQGTMKQQGYRVCSFEDYLLMQDTLDSRLKGKPAPVSVRTRYTHYNNTPLTGGAVPV